MSRSRLGAGGLHGTWRVLAFALRRDRVRLLVWLAVIALVWVAFTAELAVMQDEGQLAERALVLRGPAMIMMTGPGYGLDDYTVGAALAEEVTLWFAGALAVLSILEVVRHTRAEEESGRAELIRAAPVGRHAAAAGALLLVTGAQAAIAAVGAAVVVNALSPMHKRYLEGGGYGFIIGDGVVAGPAYFPKIGVLRADTWVIQAS